MLKQILYLYFFFSLLFFSNVNIKRITNTITENKMAANTNYKPNRMFFFQVGTTVSLQFKILDAV